MLKDKIQLGNRLMRLIDIVVMGEKFSSCMLHNYMYYFISICLRRNNVHYLFAQYHELKFEPGESYGAM